MITDMTDIKKKAFLGALGNGLSVTAAAQCAKISRQQAYQWRKKDQAFSAEWDSAIEEGTDLLEDEAKRRAMETSDTLLIFLLKARRKEKYSEKYQLTHENKTVDVTELTDEQLRRIAAEGISEDRSDGTVTSGSSSKLTH